MIVVSASASKFFNETQQMIYSCRGLLQQGTIIYILDTGLHDNQKKILQTRFNFFQIKVIDLPNDPKVCRLTSYYFKAYMIEYAFNIHNKDHYIWLDSKTNLKWNEKQIIDLCSIQPVHGINGFVIEKDFTHKNTIEAIVPKHRWEEASNSIQTQASGIIFRLQTERDLILYNEYKSHMENPDILTPSGSSRSNHRQDQSVLSCFLFKHNFTLNADWCIQHNTIFY